MNKKIQHMHNAALLLREQHSGILSTISLSQKGFPFGSVTPFLMTETGDIVIYASDIAQHSRNMKSDRRVSLCVCNGSDEDSQASARVTVLANATPDAVNDELQKQYMQVFPQAKKYVEAHDFRFYLLKTTRVRYIGGFGEIYWFEAHEWSAIMHPLAAVAKGAIEHMHKDHTDALLAIAMKAFGSLKAFSSIQAISANTSENDVCMLTCFQHGFHMAVSNKNRKPFIGFVPFFKPISDEYHLRLAMVDLTRNARVPEEKIIAAV